MFTSFRKFLTARGSHWSDPPVVFWYSLSLLFAVYYGYLVLQIAFSGDYVVQDDARQHVFWMMRFVDPTLLPNDFMADYYQSNAPSGYVWLYKSAYRLGIHPFIFAKILPPILGLITTHYCFLLSLQVLPLPSAAFTSTLILNQSLWMRDDLMSATPRAFLYPLLLAFLVYVNRRAVWPCLVVLLLQPLLYPLCGVLSAGLLGVRLLQFKNGRLTVSQDPQDYVLSGVGLLILVLLLGPYALQESAYGPVITPTEARTMPEFWPGGRSAYFNDNPIKFWFGDRSGLIPTPILTPPTMAFSLFFPWLWWRSRSVWMQIIRSNAAILQQLVVTSYLLFFAAHLVLFKLYLPSRYTHHTIRIVFALTASYTLWIFLDYLFTLIEKWGISRQRMVQKTMAGAAAVLIAIGLVGYSELLEKYPGLFNSTRHGMLPELYEFLQETPKDTITASLTKETSNLHAFTERSPFIAPELGLAYHTGYYQIFRQRAVDLIAAQYSHDPQIARTFIQRYGIDYWLIDDKVASAEFMEKNKWFNQHRREAAQAISNLKNPNPPFILGEAKSQCTRLETTPQPDSLFAQLGKNDARRYWLLDAECIASLAAEK